MTPHANAAAGLSSATLHEAAGRIGALPAAIKPLSPAMVVRGPAFPIRVAPGDNLWIQRAVYAAAPGDVLVVDTGDGLDHGYWGEVLTEAAIVRGIGGLVIHGGVRDSQRLIELGWPVFSAGVCIRGTTKDPSLPGGMDRALVIGGVPVRPRDLIVGDADGVVCIPAGHMDEACLRGRQRDEAELGYIERLHNGETTLDIYRLPASDQSADTSSPA